MLSILLKENRNRRRSDAPRRRRSDEARISCQWVRTSIRTIRLRIEEGTCERDFNHSTGLAVRRDPLTWFPCRVNSPVWLWRVWGFAWAGFDRMPLFLGSRFSVKKLAISAILEKQDKGSKSKSRMVRILLILDSSLKGLQRLIQLRGMDREVDSPFLRDKNS